MSTPEWVTITEAAVKLGVGPSKISRLVKTKKITAIEHEVDRRVKLVNLRELEKLFQRGIK